MGHKPLRYGFTTGACAAAAAKGAALMLREQQIVDEVELTLPVGVTARFRLNGQKVGKDIASCYVVKESGDDPDVTNGAEIHVSVKVDFFTSRRILLTGGPGIGRVTKPGLAVPVGEWAINPVPRHMILEVVKEIFAMRCLPITLTVTVSIPNGEELARKTLNARLGIIGGLSILGTTGIVKPISAKAWTDTIDAAIDVALACGSETLTLSCGRTSELVAQKFFSTKVPADDQPPSLPPYQGGSSTPPLTRGGREGFPEEAFVMMGDHVGYALRASARKGVREVIIAGQFAKLLKIACGHEQTHASSSDLDLQMLAQWVALDPRTSGLAPLIAEANTARQVLEASGNAPFLVKLVCGRVGQYAKTLAPEVETKVLLAGYGGEVLYFG
jgi:cobalt-precorrin-5B (C1)-methyltransferase